MQSFHKAKYFYIVFTSLHALWTYGLTDSGTDGVTDQQTEVSTAQWTERQTDILTN